MKFKTSHKILFFVTAALLLFALALYVLRQFFDLAKDLSDHGLWLLVPGLLIVGGFAFLIWRFGRKGSKVENTEIDVETIEEEFDRAEDLGVDVERMRQAFTQYRERRDGRMISLAVFGQVNAGKSTLIKALTGSSNPRSAPTVGTTKGITRYDWSDSLLYRVQMVDVPGLSEPEDESRSRAAWEEAMAADLILYVTDGDITREQMDDLKQLSTSRKPMLLLLNKSDRYSDDELVQLLDALKGRCAGFLEEDRVLAISAGGRQKVLAQNEDGSQVEKWKDFEPRLAELPMKISDLLEEDALALIALADTVFVGHMHRRLREAVQKRRHEEAARIVASHSRGAVVAAMAAVVPGIEVVLLTGIGVRMVSQLNELYGAPISSSRLETLLAAAAGQFSDAGKLSLVIGGNLLKAFPGLGTVAGGIMHAVAYGLVTRGIGLALSEALENREKLTEKAFLKKLDGYVKSLPSKDEISELISVARKLAGSKRENDE